MLASKLVDQKSVGESDLCLILKRGCRRYSLLSVPCDFFWWSYVEGWMLLETWWVRVVWVVEQIGSWRYLVASGLVMVDLTMVNWYWWWWFGNAFFGCGGVTCCGASCSRLLVNLVALSKGLSIVLVQHHGLIFLFLLVNQASDGKAVNEQTLKLDKCIRKTISPSI